MASNRVRLGRDGWRVLIEQQEASGLPIAAFCAREGLGVASFYQWRSRLSAQTKPNGDKVPQAFVDLGSMRESGRFELRIDLGCGLVLQLVRS